MRIGKFWSTAKISLLCLIACFSINTWGQFPEDLLIYYKQVAIAENHIISQQYDSAAFYYRTAFANKQYPFYMDLNNALLCEVKSSVQDIPICQSYFHKLVRLGLTSDRFSLLIGNSDWNIFKGIVDTTIVVRSKDWKEMLNDDQSVREYCRKLNKGNIYSGTCLDSIRFIDTVNVHRIRNTYKTANLFEANLIGNQGEGAMLTIFMHVFKDNRAFFMPILLEAVHQGVFDARVYAFFVDREYDDGTKLSFVGGPYGTHSLMVFCEEADDIFCFECKKHIAIFHFDKSDLDNIRLLQEINSRRKQIYLGDVIQDRYRTFKLKMCRKEGFLTSNLPVICGDSPEFNGRKYIQWWKDNNMEITYFIQGEHDFNFE